jgi:hypothetical protein
MDPACHKHCTSICGVKAHTTCGCNVWVKGMHGHRPAVLSLWEVGIHPINELPPTLGKANTLPQFGGFVHCTLWNEESYETLALDTYKK